MTVSGSDPAVAWPAAGGGKASVRNRAVAIPVTPPLAKPELVIFAGSQNRSSPTNDLGDGLIAGHPCRRGSPFGSQACMAHSRAKLGDAGTMPLPPVMRKREGGERPCPPTEADRARIDILQPPSECPCCVGSGERDLSAGGAGTCNA